MASYVAGTQVGRPARMLSTSVALPQEMLDALDSLADELGITRGQMIRNALAAYLNGQEAAGGRSTG